MTTRRRADELGHELAMRLRGAYANLRRRTSLALAPFGMTADQFVLLAVLAREGEATQQEVVRHCFSDSATMGVMLSLLEKKHLVIREPHALDGRATSVKLSMAGRRLAARMRKGSEGLRVKLVGLFSQRELKLLIELLERVAVALQPPGRRVVTKRKDWRGNSSDFTRNRHRKRNNSERRTRPFTLLKPKTRPL